MEALSHTRLGLMGHYYGGMLDIATHLTAVSSVFGTHIEMLEIDELSALRVKLTDAAVAEQAGGVSRRVRCTAGLRGG